MSYRAVVTLTALLLGVGSAIAAGELSAAAFSLQDSQMLAQAPKPRTQRPSRDNWLRELDLSQEQIQKIRDIRNQYRNRITQQRQAVLQAQRELKALMVGNASAEQMRQKFDQVQTLRQTLNDTRMESMIAIRNVLNPEQRQKLSEVLQQYGKAGRDRGDDQF